MRFGAGAGGMFVFSCVFRSSVHHRCGGIKLTDLSHHGSRARRGGRARRLALEALLLEWSTSLMIRTINRHSTCENPAGSAARARGPLTFAF